jgi:hypothetical protein
MGCVLTLPPFKALSEAHQRLYDGKKLTPHSCARQSYCAWFIQQIANVEIRFQAPREILGEVQHLLGHKDSSSAGAYAHYRYDPSLAPGAFETSKDNPDSDNDSECTSNSGSKFGSTTGAKRAGSDVDAPTPKKRVLVSEYHYRADAIINLGWDEATTRRLLTAL